MEKYLLKYKINFENRDGGYTKEDLQEGDYGGCDALVLASIKREDGNKPKSIALITKDGSNDNDIPDTELFQIFAHLAHYLSHTDVPLWQKEIATCVIEIIKNVLNDKKKQEKKAEENAEALAQWERENLPVPNGYVKGKFIYCEKAIEELKELPVYLGNQGFQRYNPDDKTVEVTFKHSGIKLANRSELGLFKITVFKYCIQDPEGSMYTACNISRTYPLEEGHG